MEQNSTTPQANRMHANCSEQCGCLAFTIFVIYSVRGENPDRKSEINRSAHRFHFYGLKQELKIYVFWNANTSINHPAALVIWRRSKKRLSEKSPRKHNFYVVLFQSWARH